MIMVKYRSRKCVMCGKEFVPQSARANTCSEQCQRERQRECSRILYHSTVPSIPAELEYLNCRLEEEIARRRMAEAKLADAALTGGKQAKASGATLARAVKSEARIYRHICTNCGGTFKSQYQQASFCCEQCAQEAAIVEM